jgi:hypothetical protein
VLVIDPVPTKSHKSLPLELEARRFLRTEAELRALFAAADLRVTRVSRLSDWGSVVETVSMQHGH